MSRFEHDREESTYLRECRHACTYQSDVHVCVNVGYGIICICAFVEVCVSHYIKTHTHRN